MRARSLEEPMSQLVRFADVRKGGGFEYVGAMLPVEKFGEAYRRGMEIVERLGIDYAFSVRIIGRAHCMMFAYAYPRTRRTSRGLRQRCTRRNIAVLEDGRCAVES